MISPSMAGDANPELDPEVRGGVYVVIPAYNEASRIVDVLTELKPLYRHVVVVDDASRDATAERARSCGADVLQHAINRGQGAALQTGIDYALMRGARFIVTFDADGQHRVEDIADLVAPLATGECDVTLGSRFLGRTVGMPFSRRVVLRLAVWFTRLVNRLPVTDAHNGLRAFTRDAAGRISITLDRMAHATEIIDQIRRARLRFREVPVEIRYTDHTLEKGQSPLNAFRIVADYFFGRISR